MIRFLHSSGALSAGLAAFLLAVAPLGAVAQNEPANPTGGGVAPGGVVAIPTVAPAAAPGDVVAAPINAKIGPGDHLAISVYGDQSLTSTAIVQQDGTIQYNLIGRVQLAGQTPTQARETLTRAFQRYIKHPVVSVSIVQGGLMNVLVMGNVKQTGRFQIRSGGHVTEAIAAAGGIAQMNGGYPQARVEVGDGSFKVVDLQKLFRAGDSRQNVALENNATIYVTGAETIRVQVLGAVTRPGVVEVFEGDRLDQALARAGAEAQVKPDFNDIYLNRRNASGKVVTYHIDLYKAIKGGDQRMDPVLQKDDSIYVPESRNRNASAAAGTVIGVLGRIFGFGW
jgi:polysaccharide export outer membrane protein